MNKPRLSYWCLAVTLSLLPLRHGSAQETRILRGFDSEIAVRPVEGKAISGQLVSLDENRLSLHDAGGQSQSWQLSELRSLEVGQRTEAMTETPPLVLLANDDVLCGPVTSGDEDTLTIDWTAVDPPQAVTIPLEVVRSIPFREPAEDLDRIRWRYVWAQVAASDDRLISINNTQLSGEFSGVKDSKVILKSVLGQFATPAEEVMAVVMNSELMSRPESEGAYVLLLFRDGSRLTCASMKSAEDGQMTAQTVWGTEVSFPLDRLARVQFLGGRVIALSSIEPAEYKFTPYLTQMLPLITNRNVKGGRLCLRGGMYATGLGASSKSEITYDLTTDKYDRFDAVVGIDDMTSGQGNVVFAVELDGKRVYESKPLGGRSPAETVGPIDVSAAKSLKLVVEFGRAANIQDVANWCDAVLTKGNGK